jgi:polyisoprenoid-binding protein YceI
VVVPSVVAHAQAHPIDAKQSTVTIHVNKSGLFSAFAHNHTISAPIASGGVDPAARTVELMFRSADLKVLDPDVSDKDRNEIHKTMQTEVLEIQRFPEISFKSRSAEATDQTHYLVKGDLFLHGVTKPVELPVTLAGGRYTGAVKIKQTEFGITPVRIAGGTVRVKDVVEISFDIATVP